MKQANTAPASAPERGREMSSKDHGTQKHDDAANAPLPHEADQNVESQHEHEARDVGKQAHEDVERGLVDTDRRGGDDYQRGTQRDDHVNANTGAKGGRKP
ncbi:hypothetical protein AWB79_07112 [Caballeronia hypogeia]|uniref:Uncharacterized protein n=1 Tax=Caballeronia hypogeia TaxID=1777140 RepID=A0A158DIX8_9BURK|nr:hypothetical protein [Caballeronia hypogeia]SAK94534.1 hypothetical protein AWB79_07112 [Caballeronia hypogeia]